MKPDTERPIIQRTGKTSFSVIKFSPCYYPCEVSRVTFHRKDSLLMKDPPRGRCQERVTDMSLAGSYYRQCPTATEDDSGRRGNCYSRREGGHDRLVGDWTVPDQFGFTFRVELRMTVIDRHQGHANFSMVAIDSCNLIFSLSMGIDLTTDSKYKIIFFAMIINVTDEY